MRYETPALVLPPLISDRLRELTHPQEAGENEKYGQGAARGWRRFTRGFVSALPVSHLAKRSPAAPT